RRRHTRSKRDWSSDVCSSDLHLKIRVKIYVFQISFSFHLQQHEYSSHHGCLLQPLVALYAHLNHRIKSLKTAEFNGSNLVAVGAGAYCQLPIIRRSSGAFSIVFTVHETL